MLFTTLGPAPARLGPASPVRSKLTGVLTGVLTGCFPHELQRFSVFGLEVPHGRPDMSGSLQIQFNLASCWRRCSSCSEANLAFSRSAASRAAAIAAAAAAPGGGGAPGTLGIA